MRDNSARTRSQVCISIDLELLRKARDFGINISRAAEDGIMQALHIDRPAPVIIDPVQTMKEKLKPLMLEKMKRDIVVFDKVGEIKHVERWVRIIKTMCGIKVKLDDMRTVTADVVLQAPLLIIKFCKNCKAETEHEHKKRIVGGMVRGWRDTCTKCLCFE